MDFEQAILDSEIVLTEGAVVEQIKRDSPLELDPYIMHAGFVFDQGSRETLTKIYREYLDIGAAFDLPMIVGTPTWRANPDRVGQALDFSCYEVNCQGVEFLKSIRSEYGEYSSKILIGGVLGPKGDAYDPDDSPTLDEAIDFHETQIRSLADAGADFLLACTLPSAPEAYGISQCLSEIGVPYILSFVLRPTGCLLDGTPLHEAVETIDGSTDYMPLCYWANCVHPTVYYEAMVAEMEVDGDLNQRVVGLQANTSALPPEALDGCVMLQGEDPSTFSDLMLKLNREFSTSVLGGCCGTGPDHIRALAEKLSREAK